MEFLAKVIDIFQNTEIGNGWKPINTGMILATMSLCTISEMLIENGYKFVLLHRFTQDALENIFSQIRRKAGSHPSALQSLRALKLITVSQFISDVKRSSYLSDTDEFLLEHFKVRKSPTSTIIPQSSSNNSIDASMTCHMGTFNSFTIISKHVIFSRPRLLFSFHTRRTKSQSCC